MCGGAGGGGVVFFFQAEDGIRDWSVTGVQTCALPIWGVTSSAGPAERKRLPLGLVVYKYQSYIRFIFNISKPTKNEQQRQAESQSLFFLWVGNIVPLR